MGALQKDKDTMFLQLNSKTSVQTVFTECPYKDSLPDIATQFYMLVSKIQSTLVISNSLISNYRLSRSENLAPVLTKRATKRQQNI